jgi:hypothetical protein
MPHYQCEHCGQPLEVGHNCNGAPFVSAPPQNSIPAIGARKEILHRKGFHQTSYPGDVYYDHPMYGRVCIYPGGAIKVLFAKTELPVDKYLESLDDSSYAVDATTQLLIQRVAVFAEKLEIHFQSNSAHHSLTRPTAHKENSNLSARLCWSIVVVSGRGDSTTSGQTTVGVTACRHRLGSPLTPYLGDPSPFRVLSQTPFLRHSNEGRTRGGVRLACASRPIQLTTLSVCNTRMRPNPMNRNRLEDGVWLSRAAKMVHA